VIDHKPASDSAKSSFEEPVPKIYEWSAPRARYFKAIIQMAIGAVAAAIVVGMGIFLALPPGHAHTGKNIQTHVFTTIGVALAIAAGVELAYTLFTHGPDEALDPLMLGLSAALILQLAKVDGFDLKQASSAVIYVIALGVTFAIRKFLAKDPKFTDWDPPWSRHRENHTADVAEVAGGAKYRAPAASGSPVEELTKLADMLEEGLLTREEFDLMKGDLISPLSSDGRGSAATP
jgi:hypothetical protein